MFRKPKSKKTDADKAASTGRNIRQRMDEELETAQSISNERELEKPNEDFPQHNAPKNTGLSFNEEEGDDVINFKLKKHSSHHKSFSASDKTLRKHRALVERMERLKATTIAVKKEEPIEPDVVFDGERQATTNGQKQEQTQKFKIPDDGKHQLIIDAEVDFRSKDTEVREAFPSAFAGIPDAKAVYEAKKKREMMRHVGISGAGGEYIPLDDTVRLKGNAHYGERARLVREDENDISDEEETGSFYSAKKLLQSEEEKRREEQAHFLEIEQGGSDEEDAGGRNVRGTTGVLQEDYEEEDELQRWEREQIRKGVSSQKVMQMQEELNATSMHFRGRKYLHGENGAGAMGGGAGEAEMEIDVDIEMLEIQQQRQTVQKGMPSLPIDGSIPSTGKPSVSLQDILEGLQDRLREKQEIQNTKKEELSRVQGQTSENTELVHKLEHGMPELERKFRMFQDVRLYTRDLLDCLNEKIEQINALEEKIMEMWKQRTERLIGRRRQDIQDQYQRCQMAASGRPFTAPNPEFAQRETEREARRNRRRLQREQQRLTPGAARNPTAPLVHYEGLSSDDEETNSQEVFYREMLASVQQSAQDLFLDTEDDFSQIDQIFPHLLSWLAIDSRTFEDAYVPLCLPKLIGPFIRLQMLHWRPLKDSSESLHSLPWYRQLLSVGLDNSGLADLEHPVLVQLIPSVVEKIVIPKIARIVREQWDPLSLSESTNLATLLHTLVDEYPIASAESKRMQELLQQVHAKIRESLEKDMFVPLYNKEAIEATETGCGAFMDRQFWKSIKLMRSIHCFRTLLSDACIEELLLEGLVNRYTVLALQFSVISNPATVVKCRALMEQIPANWLPSLRPSSYRPFAMVLKKIIEIHSRTDRKFTEQAQKFVELALTNTVKEEQQLDED